jgi:hypothetical protein
MNVQDLQHIFRHQTTATEDYTPPDTLEYMLIDSSGRLTKTCAVDQLDTLLPLLDNFIFEGFRDRMPIFIKPESGL